VKTYVSKGETVLVRIWSDGKIEVVTRPDSSCTWGPPVRVYEEREL
jgi:hypothetical protein